MASQFEKLGKNLEKLLNEVVKAQQEIRNAEINCRDLKQTLDKAVGNVNVPEAQKARAALDQTQGELATAQVKLVNSEAKIKAWMKDIGL